MTPARALVSAAAVALCAACVGTTGGTIVDFRAAAAGPSDAVAGQPYTFTTDRGWTVTLTKAVLHVGALYLDQSEPVSGAQNTSCILPGYYVVQETTGRDVDLLSPKPQLFPQLAHGTTLPALVGQVWLDGADINAVSDTTPILQLQGTAVQGATSIPFEGKITIGSNRASTGSTPGANPICKQRIVSPIPLSLTVQTSGGLLLRVSPRYLFTNVDFSKLAKFSDTYGFSDDPTSTDYTQPSVNLYSNLHAASALYSFAWSNDPIFTP